jgi:prepilin-type N-terminal cleavage/methylation domain-containing protein
MMRKQVELKNSKKAFSLIEVLVGLGVISIVMVIFFNVLLISITITVRNTARSAVREEISTIASLITKDVRRADRLDTSTCMEDSCEIIVENSLIRWYLCNESQVCKEDRNGDVIFESDPSLIVTNFVFEQGFVDSTSSIKNNVLVTIVGDHANESLEINNVVRQVSISTRNYEL